MSKRKIKTFEAWLVLIPGVLFGVILGSFIPRDTYSGSAQQQFDKLAFKFMQLAQLEKAEEALVLRYQRYMILKEKSDR